MREAGLTLAAAQLLSGAGWRPERLEMLHDWAALVGATFEAYRLSARSVVMELHGRKWMVHRDLTQEKALLLWAGFPSGALVEAWTDGSGLTTDEAVGAAAVMKAEGYLGGAVNFTHAVHAADGKVSSQIAELYGIALAIANCPRVDLQLHIFSDSQYGLGIVDITKGWQPKANQELISEIRHLLALRPARLTHIRGHTGITLNEQADRLAGSIRITSTSSTHASNTSIKQSLGHASESRPKSACPASTHRRKVRGP